MRLTFQEISARLTAIAELLAKIEHEHLLTDTPDFQNLKMRFNKLNNRILETITEEELRKFEQESCSQIVLDHLDSSAALYNIPWTRPPAQSIPRDNSIAWLSLQCDNFIQPWDTEIKSLQRPSKKDKKAARINDSDEPDNPLLAVNPLLCLQLQKLKPIFVEIKKSHFHLLPTQYHFIKASSASLINVKLVQWQAQYQEDTERAHNLIHKVSEKLMGIPFSDNGYKEQGQLLLSSIERLKELNANREVLAEKILAEQGLAFPVDSANQQQLAALRQDALYSLKKTLHSFVHFVIEIDAKNKGPEFQDFTKALSQFVMDFTNDLTEGTPSIANSEAVSKLKNLLSDSVDTNNSLAHSTEQSNTSSDAIHDLMNQLFSTACKTENDLEEHSLQDREQIERIYSIRAKLQDRAIEKSAQYFKLQNKITQTKTTIADQKNINRALVTQLQERITPLIDELKLKCKLIWFGSPIYIKAHENVKQLLELQIELSNVSVAIENETFSIANGINLHSLLKQFEDSKSNNAFSKALKEMAQLQDSSEIKLKKQQNIQKHLDGITVGIQDISSTSTELDDFYEKEKAQLHKNLTSKITEAKLALQSLGWEINPIKQILKPQIDLAHGINEKNIPLSRIQANVAKVLISLDSVITEATERKELRNKLQAKITDTTRALQSLGWNNDLISQTLQPQHDLSHEIFLRNNPLTRSQAKVLKALTYLDRTISETNEKKELRKSLQIKITEASFILKLVGWDADQINHDLKSQIDLSAKIHAKNYSISYIQAKVRDAQTTLDARIHEIKASFRKDITIQQEAIQKRCFDLTEGTKQFDHYQNLHIPFFGVLKKANNDLNQQHLDYQLHIPEFDLTEGEALKRWYETYRRKYNTLQTGANTCDELLVGAHAIQIEIERRLNSKPYQISVKILTDLKKEFNRIFDKHLNLSRHLSPEKIDALKNIKSRLLSQSGHTSEINVALKLIDPRLSKLAEIFYKFEKINHEYLRSNYHPSAKAADYRIVDQNYINALQERADQSLRSCDMEKMSDGVRSGLVQWIRNHIVKPLQHLRKKNSFVFFPTKLACKTEKTLVEMGNDVHQQLTLSTG